MEKEIMKSNKENPQEKEIVKTSKEKKSIEKENKDIQKKEKITTSEEKNSENKSEVSKEENQKVAKKKEKKKIVKDLAIARGVSLRISLKHAVAICKVIKGKSPEGAIKRLSEVVEKKRVIPMAGREVAHQKGKGIAGAKFPKNASIAISEIVKQARANATVAGIENPIITLAIANKAQTPLRRGGIQSKRTHLKIEVREKSKLANKKKK